ncbi:glycosyltransferase family 2 protein [Methylomonas montana]|uniref:glycosyltransferase family 2 protein n=1 Tax=Methylomonas montana TaxID=3058963 RepID=UPI00265A622D|nr:glycosyltransferase family 2 protein [Methylomonas montana]WKJ92555.1 glycosyltransferase family 2 protein [Methylomonas montana]
MTTLFNPCILIPVYNHENPLTGIVERLSAYRLPCLLVDDGSDASCAAIIRSLADRYSWVQSIRLELNQGKGAAVKAGILAAQAQAYSHALQIDADGQHDLDDLAKFLAATRQQPDAVVIGRALFDASIPKLRFYARYLTHAWVHINTLSCAIPDSMCGYRVYPVASCAKLIQSIAMENRMGFDTEILVRLYWQGVTVISIPTQVRYPLDGLSHFRAWEDNLLLSQTHARLFFGMLLRLPKLLARHFR